MEMGKGPFSVEWLAQSSRGGARPAGPRSPPGGPETPADLGESRLSSRAGRATGRLVAAVSVTVPARETVRGQQPHLRPLPTSPPPPALDLPPPPRRVPAAALRDREAAGRSSPGHDANGGGPTAPGRPRTKFSAAQLQELERSFREQRYIGASEKRRLAALLNLSQSQIKTWFQNRRMKFKRQTQDARVEALFSGLFLPYRCYPDVATSRYSHGMDISISSTSAVSLHTAMPSPSLLLPSVPAQSLQPVLPSPALLLPPSPGLSCYSSVIPAMTLTDDHKRLRFQPYLPSC
ncbi:homeobox protein vex1-like [Phalacrocorax carbo]|uniref:homeobox protein vex1-like n=1 Tax=Phalacrocorax carbo TaxID=9209 RepID=UPI003119E158